jgi:hypothetical protein
VSVKTIREKYSCVIEVLTTRGRRYKSSRGAATDIIVKCPCCKKNRYTTDWAIELHALRGSSPVGWCKTCAMTLSSHKDWIDILPILWDKHGKWSNRIIGRFNICKRIALERKFDFDLTPLDLPEIPPSCPVFPWIKFEITPRRQENKGYAHDRAFRSLAPSLDRIDSNKGYIKGNVRWICSRANALKSNMTYKEAEALFSDIKKLFDSGVIYE